MEEHILGNPSTILAGFDAIKPPKFISSVELPYSAHRNVHVYAISGNLPVIVAGFRQHGSVTVEMFYRWLNICLFSGGEWRLFPATDTGQFAPGGIGLLPADDSPFPLGNYVILAPDALPTFVTSRVDLVRPRTFSANITGTSHTQGFRNKVRARDDRCCISGKRVYSHHYAIHQEVHIWPLAHKDIWTLAGMEQYIEDDTDTSEIDSSKINSIQNGLLLRVDVHALFDSYLLAIDPDDNYRVHDFTVDGDFNDLTMWRNPATQAKYLPSDELLRRHFRNCVLANVRGVGQQPDWRSWDPEEEMNLEDVSGWGAKVEGGRSRLELELANRLCLLAT